MTTNTAILLFSRTPQEEARSKKFASRRNTIAVTKVLRTHSIRQAKMTGLPVFQCTGCQQQGNTFGERLANATESIFAKGYKQLLIIGNDSPDLNADELKKAYEQLSYNKLVLGPSLDGGVYLIGLTADTYRRDLFTQLAWETAQLQHTFQNYAQLCDLQTIHLAALADIDDTQGFWQFLRTLSVAHELLPTLIQLFRVRKKPRPTNYIPSLSLADFFGHPSLRGPPILG